MTIAERIQKILDAEKLSPSRFADEIGVQRSSLSHILSGRNNPGFDYLIKILTRFDNLDANWLLTGKGGMYKSDIKSNNKLLEVDESRKSDRDSTDESIFRNDPPAEYGSGKKSLNEIHKMREDNISVNQHEIQKIIEFYPDHTFSVYYPSAR